MVVLPELSNPRPYPMLALQLSTVQTTIILALENFMT
jgi:hypothetical protein